MGNRERTEKKIGDYPVVLTWKDYSLPQKAKIIDVEINPRWYRTPGIKERYFKKFGKHLKDIYESYEDENAMGSFKWVLDFLDEPGYYPGDDRTRVHEAKNPSKIGTKDSSGCVRLLKKDGLFLSKLMWGHKDRTIIYTKSNK